MGEWTKYYNFYGGFAKSGNAQDVALIGGEVKPYPFNVNLERANKSGFAKGIRFKNSDRVVTMECSLAPIVLNFQTAKPIYNNCLLYTSPSPRDRTRSRMPSSA